MRPEVWLATPQHVDRVVVSTRRAQGEIDRRPGDQGSSCIPAGTWTDSPCRSAALPPGRNLPGADYLEAGKRATTPGPQSTRPTAKPERSGGSSTGSDHRIGRSGRTAAPRSRTSQAHRVLS